MLDLANLLDKNKHFYHFFLISETAAHPKDEAEIP